MSYLDELEAQLADVEIAPCEFDEPATAIYLTGASTPGARAAGRHNLGVLAQPGNTVHRDHEHYPAGFAADNGCFAQGERFDTDAWLRWVVTEIAPQARRCLFVVAPDVVGDAAATILRSRRLLPIIQKLGLPAAFVAQDGLEDLEVPWDSFDVLFIGGSTEWKLSAAAARLSAEARERGKWVHVGRVNSWKRCDLIRRLHADSADGTYLAFAPEANLPSLLRWLDRYDADVAPYAALCRRTERTSSTGMGGAGDDR